MAFEGITSKLQSIFAKLGSKGKLTENEVKESMREIRLALLEADVNYIVVKDFVKSVSERAVGAGVLESLTPGQQVIKIVHEELIKLMGVSNVKLEFGSKKPAIILMAGLQGSGKTTMTGKLAGYITKYHNKSVLLAACDVYRPAAIKQLQVVGEKVGVPVFEQGQSDPVKIALSAVEEARRTFKDVVIVDTAGRLHIDDNLMDEMERIKAALDPSEILLVVDAMTGQDAVNVAKSFNERLEITGVVMSKLDGDTRGGAALSVRQVTNKPIKFSGTGEKLTDIEPFHPDRMASRILGMGDVLTLIEKAQEAYTEKQARELEQKIMNDEFTLEDFLEQFSQIKNMGSYEEIFAMLGVNQAQMRGMEIDEKQIARNGAIILSMTPAERRKPSLLNASRRRRIAAGSGTSVQDVNALLKQYEKSREMMRMVSGFGKKKKGGKRMKLPFGFK